MSGYGIVASLLLRLDARVGEFVAIDDLAAHFGMAAQAVREACEKLHADQLIRVDRNPRTGEIWRAMVSPEFSPEAGGRAAPNRRHEAVPVPVHADFAPGCRYCLHVVESDEARDGFPSSFKCARTGDAVTSLQLCGMFARRGPAFPIDEVFRVYREWRVASS